MKNLTELTHHNGQKCSLDLSLVVGIIPQERGCFLMTSTGGHFGRGDSGICVLESKVEIDKLMGKIKD